MEFKHIKLLFKIMVVIFKNFAQNYCHFMPLGKVMAVSLVSNAFPALSHSFKNIFYHTI